MSVSHQISYIIKTYFKGPSTISRLQKWQILRPEKGLLNPFQGIERQMDGLALTDEIRINSRQGRLLKNLSIK